MRATTRRPIDDTGNTAEAIREWQREQQEAAAIRETEVEDQSGGDWGTEAQQDTDISHKEFRFNPPLHESNLSRVPDLSNSSITAKKFYDEDSVSDYRKEWSETGFGNLRLGRIIQHHLAPGQVSLMKHRWGFRFLYNPTTISYTSSRNDSFIIDPRSETNKVLSGINQNFQNVSFSVLLDRVPDVVSGIPDDDAYSPALTKDDKEGILRYGTHWDMEALLKVCNGEWNLTDRGKTSNIGVLIPSNARLILGPGVNLYGFINSISWKDEMFSVDMVPIRTRLDIVFRRHVEMSAEQVEKSFPGIASTTPTSTSPTDGSSSEASGNGGTEADPYEGNTVSAPVPGYNTVTTRYLKPGDWSGGYHTGADYGLGGIRGKRVISTRKGNVVIIGRAGGGGLGWWAGNHVVIQTGNVRHLYCHMETISSNLRTGTVVDAGTFLGTVGNTGNVRPPGRGWHLHYEERVLNRAGWSHRNPIWGNK